MRRVMDPTVGVCLAAVLLAGASGQSVAGGGVHVFAGPRWNSGGEPWQDDPTFAGGFHVDLGRSAWPVNVAFGYQLALGDLVEDGEEIGDIEAHEEYVGIVRARGELGGWGRALAGGGISRAVVQAEQNVLADASDTDAVPGLYAHAGFFAGYGPRLLALGIEARAVLGGKVDLLGIDGSTSYVQLAVIFGGFGN